MLRQAAEMPFVLVVYATDSTSVTVKDCVPCDAQHRVRIKQHHAQASISFFINHHLFHVIHQVCRRSRIGDGVGSQSWEPLVKNWYVQLEHLATMFSRF